MPTESEKLAERNARANRIRREIGGSIGSPYRIHEATENRSRRHRYMVGIRKEYFPANLHPPVKEMTAYFEVVRGVLASSRTEAATHVWAKHGERWLSLMKPDTTLRGNRIVSLEVNDPVRRIGPSRLSAVKVHEGNSERS